MRNFFLCVRLFFLLPRPYSCEIKMKRMHKKGRQHVRTQKKKDICVPFSYKIKRAHTEPSIYMRSRSVSWDGLKVRQRKKGPKSIMVNVISLARMENKGGLNIPIHHT